MKLVMNKRAILTEMDGSVGVATPTSSVGISGSSPIASYGGSTKQIESKKPIKQIHKGSANANAND